MFMDDKLILCAGSVPFVVIDRGAIDLFGGDQEIVFVVLPGAGHRFTFNAASFSVAQRLETPTVSSFGTRLVGDVVIACLSALTAVNIGRFSRALQTRAARCQSQSGPMLLSGQTDAIYSRPIS